MKAFIISVSVLGFIAFLFFGMYLFFTWKYKRKRTRRFKEFQKRPSKEQLRIQRKESSSTSIKSEQGIVEDLTKREEWIFNYLKKQVVFTSPTEIGNAYERSCFTQIEYDNRRAKGVSKYGSSVGSKICKQLVEKGLVERSETGYYRVI